MAFLRFTRDKRGYEHFYLVQPTTNRRGKVRNRILYWFRTAPNVKVGREPFDEALRRALEAQNPDVSFDWQKIIETPIPSADTEKWRERRRVERAERAARQTESEDEESLGGAADVPMVTAEVSAAELTAAALSAAKVSITEVSTTELSSMDDAEGTEDPAGGTEILRAGEPQAERAEARPAESRNQLRRRRRRRGRRGGPGTARTIEPLERLQSAEPPRPSEPLEPREPLEPPEPDDPKEPR